MPPGTRNAERGTAGGFEVIPAVDLRGGRCVRLFQGDYARETAYSGDPVAVARQWEALGAPRLHVVDLDGAKDGEPRNGATIAAICAAVAIPVEVSGGLRSLDTVRAAFAGGAGRVQLGSAAVRNPRLVREVLDAFPGRLSVSIDVRGGEVMANGWLEGTGVALLDLARAMAEAGVPRVMVTDIVRDGALEGPNLDLYRTLTAALAIPVVASAGVTSIAHLRALAAAGCEGAVVGKALYEGLIRLDEAVAALSGLNAPGEVLS